MGAPAQWDFGVTHLGVIVGATGGIGSACARQLVNTADHIVLTGRHKERLGALSRELRVGTTGVQADISRTEDRELIVRTVSATGLPIGWLVFASGAPLRGPIDALDVADIESAIAVNLAGPALLLRMLLDLTWEPLASVVLIGSISASRSLPRRSVYGGTKAGVEHLFRAAAADLAPRGIRINVVAPGVVDTAFLGEDRSTLDAWIDDHVPMRRIGDPAEVAGLVKYLVTDAPRYLTGARFAVDGGAETVA